MAHSKLSQRRVVKAAAQVVMRCARSKLEQLRKFNGHENVLEVRFGLAGNSAHASAR